MSPNSPVQIPKTVYGRVAMEQLLSPCMRKIEELFNDKTLSAESKLNKITYQVLSLQQPIVHLITNKENLEWDSLNNPNVVHAKDLYEGFILKSRTSFD